MAIETMSPALALLVDIAIGRIRAGLVPREVAFQQFTRAAGERVCGICDAAMSEDDYAYELSAPSGAVCHFHVPCFDAWTSACAQLDSQT